MVKNLPSNAGDGVSALGQAAEIPHAAGQLKVHVQQEELQTVVQSPCIQKAVPQTENTT